MPSDLALPFGERGGVRQFALQDQVRDLEVGAVRRQVLDRIAAMAERPGATVEIGDRAPARGRVAERRIVGDQLAFVRPFDLPQVGGGDGVGDDGHV